MRSRVTPLREYVVGNVAQTLWILLGAVLAVFAVACTNVANLLLVRGEARARERAIRTALGATRSSLLRLFAAFPP